MGKWANLIDGEEAISEFTIIIMAWKYSWILFKIINKVIFWINFKSLKYYMSATLTIRIDKLPSLQGSLVKNVFTHFFDDNSEISSEMLVELQESKEPVSVLIRTEEIQEEYKAYITHINERSVQFLLFSD